MSGGFHGCKVALFVGERLVLLRRDGDPGIDFPGMWDFPGGGREADETPEETLAREVAEETALDMARARLLWSVRLPRPAGGHAWFFVARLPADDAGVMRLGLEGQELRLMPLADVLALPDLVPHLRDRLRLWLDR